MRNINKVLDAVDTKLVEMGVDEGAAFQFKTEVSELYKKGWGISQIAEYIYDNEIPDPDDDEIDESVMIDESEDSTSVNEEQVLTAPQNMGENITIVISWPDDQMIAQDCFQGLNSDVLPQYPNVTGSEEDNIIELTGPQVEINAIVEQIVDAYKEFGVPTIQTVEEPEEQIIDVPDQYERDPMGESTDEEANFTNWCLELRKKVYDLADRDDVTKYFHYYMDLGFEEENPLIQSYQNDEDLDEVAQDLADYLNNPAMSQMDPCFEDFDEEIDESAEIRMHDDINPELEDFMLEVRNWILDNYDIDYPEANDLVNKHKEFLAKAYIKQTPKMAGKFIMAVADYH